MAVNEKFRDAVKRGDVSDVRAMMSVSLSFDHTLQRFQEMAKIAGNMPGLYDPDDGAVLERDPSAWNKDYLDRQMTEVLGNFSHRRLDHLQEVIRKLYPEAKPEQPAQGDGTFRPGMGTRGAGSGGKVKSYRVQKREDEENGRILRVVAGGAVVGAIAGLGISAIVYHAGATATVAANNAAAAGAAAASSASAAGPIGFGLVIGAAAGAGISYFYFIAKGGGD